MADSPAVIIGNPASIFPRRLASLWRSLGLDPVIVTRHWSGEHVLPDGTRILASADAESPNERRAYRAFGRLLDAFEARLHIVPKRRYTSAMGLETHYKPRVSPAIADALSVSHFTGTLRPQLVCGRQPSVRAPLFVRVISETGSPMLGINASDRWGQRGSSPSRCMISRGASPSSRPTRSRRSPSSSRASSAQAVDRVLDAHCRAYRSW